jgi:hypothetical protein
LGGPVINYPFEYKGARSSSSHSFHFHSAAALGLGGAIKISSLSLSLSAAARIESILASHHRFSVSHSSHSVRRRQMLLHFKQTLIGFTIDHLYACWLLQPEHP